MTHPYKNGWHAVADGLIVCGLALATRLHRRRRRGLAEPTPKTSRPADAEPVVYELPPRELTLAEAKTGYCWLCGHAPCTCVDRGA